MRISKHTHSCLLVEEEGRVVLIDPGVYTTAENTLDINKLDHLDYLLITHEHPDHMDISLIKKILEKFPGIKVVGNSSIAEILGKEGINVRTEGDDFIKMELVSHEPVFGVKAPANTLFTVGGKLSHPGDSFSFEKCAEILALPITAPWGSTTQAVELALKLKPKIIIPIHDWQLKDEARESMYQRLTDFFAKSEIDFKIEV